MLMPVPAEICKHPDFSLVFGAAHASEAEAPYCAVVANHEHKRLIQILHEDRVYEISSWDQVKPSIGDTEMSPLGAGAAEEGAPEDAASSAAAGGAAGSEKEDWLQAPVAKGDAGKVGFDGEEWVPHSKGSLGWLSKFLEPMLDEACKAQELDEPPRIWVSESTKAKMVDQTEEEDQTGEEEKAKEIEAEAAANVLQIMQMGFPRKAAEAALSKTDGNVQYAITQLLENGSAFDHLIDGPEEIERSRSATDEVLKGTATADEVAAEVAATPLAPLRLVMYVAPQGDLDERKESPGCWYEISVVAGDNPMDCRRGPLLLGEGGKGGDAPAEAQDR